MDQPQKSVAPRGGRVLAKVVAVLLALGVLGYLMWRSQGGDDRVEAPGELGDLGEYRPLPCVGDFSSLPSLPERGERLEFLFSSKLGVIAPGGEGSPRPRRLAYSIEQVDGANPKPEGNATGVAPEPEAPR